MPIITIMICTYKRSNDLKRTIESLINVNYDINKINLVIVDNDTCGSAKSVIDEFKDVVRIRYEIENNKGISYARNRCISIAKKIKSNYVAFIDDDEIVCKEWLKELIKVLNTYEGDIVRGPVVRQYPNNTPKWIIKSKVFENDILEDGTELNICFTGNVLMKKQIINDNSFDVKYAISGGEDTKFFMNLYKNGKKILYAKNAIVYEKLEENRVNLNYIIKRRFRDSANYVLIERDIYDTSAFSRIIKSIIKIFINIIGIPFAIFGGYSTILKIILNIIEANGQLYGIITKKTVKGY